MRDLKTAAMFRAVKHPTRLKLEVMTPSLASMLWLLGWVRTRAETGQFGDPTLLCPLSRVTAFQPEWGQLGAFWRIASVVPGHESELRRTDAHPMAVSCSGQVRRTVQRLRSLLGRGAALIA